MCAQSCPTLCDPMDSSPPGSSVHGILQARILEWVAISFSRGSSQPRDRILILASPALADEFFTTSATWEAIYVSKPCSKRYVLILLVSCLSPLIDADGKAREIK